MSVDASGLWLLDNPSIPLVGDNIVNCMDRHLSATSQVVFGVV